MDICDKLRTFERAHYGFASDDEDRPAPPPPSSPPADANGSEFGMGLGLGLGEAYDDGYETVELERIQDNGATVLLLTKK